MLKCYSFQPNYSSVSSDCEYRFLTQYNLAYLVYFINVTKIIDVLDNYPVLSNGMFMGIELMSDGNSSPAFDANIGLTISNIVKDYLEHYGTDSILVFSCDEKDGKQEKRHLKFTRWFTVYASDTNFQYHQKIIAEESDEAVITHFLAVMYSAKHKRAELIKKEIKKLEAWLTSEKE